MKKNSGSTSTILHPRIKTRIYFKGGKTCSGSRTEKKEGVEKKGRTKTGRQQGAICQQAVWSGSTAERGSNSPQRNEGLTVKKKKASSRS